MTPIALRTDQLEHGDQIDRFVARGLLAGRPTASSPLVDWHDESQPLEARARAYLHGNCASCHREAGMAAHTGVRLGIEITDAARLGICRAPTLTDASGSGGRPFVMSPGDPSQSVMAHRLESTLWGVHMPFGSTVIDEGGVELIEAWIEGMPSAPCPH